MALADYIYPLVGLPARDAILQCGDINRFGGRKAAKTTLPQSHAGVGHLRGRWSGAGEDDKQGEGGGQLLNHLLHLLSLIPRGET